MATRRPEDDSTRGVLADILRKEIAGHGPMPFDQFMDRALYDPEHGYYARDMRIGKGADFITSPAVSSLFGRILADQILEVWRHLGKPSTFDLIEQGAGDGGLMRAIVLAVRESDRELATALRCTIIEPLISLRKLQQAALETDGIDARWLDSEQALCRVQAGVHYSNELPDAMPCHWVESDGQTWKELHVINGHTGDKFQAVALPPSSPELEDALAFLPKRPAGYRTEVGLRARHWLHRLASRIEAGLILVFDYGLPRQELYAPSRPQGTLRTYANHRQGHDPLAAPGEIDITAHVDFTALFEAASAAGWRLSGFADQHHFLVTAARDRLLSWEKNRDFSEVAAFKMLTHPAAMGTSYHALGLTKGISGPTWVPSGFSGTRACDVAALCGNEGHKRAGAD